MPGHSGTQSTEVNKMDTTPWLRGAYLLVVGGTQNKIYKVLDGNTWRKRKQVEGWGARAVAGGAGCHSDKDGPEGLAGKAAIE